MGRVEDVESIEGGRGVEEATGSGCLGDTLEFLGTLDNPGPRIDFGGKAHYVLGQ
jgi:hypothetical protein